MIATTIEQSKRLLELGLDPASADMEFCYIDEFNSGLQVKGDINAEVDRRLDMMFGVTHIPAWSLSALLEVMPKETLPALEYREGNKEWEANVWIHHNIHCISHYDKMCAVYSMVCWLLEQGLIKKGGQDERD